MYPSNAYNTYKQNSVNFSSKEQLLLMLVDGAAKYVKIARQAILDKNISKAHDNLTRTQDIFYELMATLDVSSGENWLKNLMALYEFITRKLAEANIKKSTEILDEVIPLIDEIKDMWHEVYKLAASSR